MSTQEITFSDLETYIESNNNNTPLLNTGGRFQAPPASDDLTDSGLSINEDYQFDPTDQVDPAVNAGVLDHLLAMTAGTTDIIAWSINRVLDTLITSTARAIIKEEAMAPAPDDEVGLDLYNSLLAQMDASQAHDAWTDSLGTKSQELIGREKLAVLKGIHDTLRSAGWKMDDLNVPFRRYVTDWLFVNVNVDYQRVQLMHAADQPRVQRDARKESKETGEEYSKVLARMKQENYDAHLRAEKHRIQELRAFLGGRNEEARQLTLGLQGLDPLSITDLDSALPQFAETVKQRLNNYVRETDPRKGMNVARGTKEELAGARYEINLFLNNA